MTTGLNDSPLRCAPLRTKTCSTEKPNPEARASNIPIIYNPLSLLAGQTRQISSLTVFHWIQSLIRYLAKVEKHWIGLNVFDACFALQVGIMPWIGG